MPILVQLRRSLLSVASGAGYAWREARRPVRFLPELVGLGLISWGVAMIYIPAGLIAVGASLMVVGSRISP
jgi:hypothetical protein